MSDVSRQFGNGTERRVKLLFLVRESFFLELPQHKEFERVGGSETIKVDVKIILATNKDLEEEVKAGRFREDLYYRIRVIQLSLPPLSERKEDIPSLTTRLGRLLHRCQKYCRIMFEIYNECRVTVLWWESVNI